MRALCPSFALSWLLMVGFAVALPTTTVGTDQTESLEVPREFPKLDQNYTFVDNSSIRENLANHADVDTEVDDLLEDDENKKIEEEQEHDDIQPVPEEDSGPKVEVEWIEDGDDTEDSKFETSSTQSKVQITSTAEARSEETPTTEARIEVTPSEAGEIETEQIQIVNTNEEVISETVSEDEPYKDGVPLIDGTVAAILVGVFLVICVLGYTALIVWRKSLESKYGSRQMLVDKEDMYDPDDITHFSI